MIYRVQKAGVTPWEETWNQFLELWEFYIGGIALPYWGFARLTHDIDIKVLVPDTNYPKVRNAIRKAFPNPAR